MLPPPWRGVKRRSSIDSARNSAQPGHARYLKSCPGIENLKLDDLAAKRVYEFAFVMQPLKAQGFSGSTVAPVAIR